MLTGVTRRAARDEAPQDTTATRRLAWIITAIGVTLLLAVTLVRSSPPPSASGSGGWRFDLREDFDSLSPSRWNVKNNTFSTNESSYLLARNVSAGNGVLRVQGKREEVGGRHYSS